MLFALVICRSQVQKQVAQPKFKYWSRSSSVVRKKELPQLSKAKSEDVTENVARAQMIPLELTSAGEHVTEQ
jgi:hypothetical protein